MKFYRFYAYSSRATREYVFFSRKHLLLSSHRPSPAVHSCGPLGATSTRGVALCTTQNITETTVVHFFTSTTIYKQAPRPATTSPLSSAGSTSSSSSRVARRFAGQSVQPEAVHTFHCIPELARTPCARRGVTGASRITATTQLPNPRTGC